MTPSATYQGLIALWHRLKRAQGLLPGMPFDCNRLNNSHVILHDDDFRRATAFMDGSNSGP